MPVLTPAQIYALARQAGFSPAQAVIATGITQPESGGDTTAHNTNASTGDNSYGLWQINMLGSLGPARRAEFGISSNDELFDPAVNARAAYAVFRSQGWNAWTGYRTGAYRGSFYAAALKAASSAGFSVTNVLKTIGRDIAGGTRNAVGLLTGSTEEKIATSIGEKVVGSIWNTVGAKVLFVGLALGLVGLGAYQSLKPRIRAAQNRAAELGGIAAKGAVAA